jgi:rubrerythrin
LPEKIRLFPDKITMRKGEIIMPRAKRWQCTVCGYLHEDAAPPKVCPTCGVEASRFVLFK